MAAAVAAVGAIVGTGVTVQVNAAEAERIAVEQKLEQELTDRREAAQVAFDEAFDAAHKRQAENSALTAVDKATPVIAAAEGKADASTLSASVAALTSYEILEPAEVHALAKQVDATIPVVQAAIAEADRIAAEREARLAAEREAAEREAARVAAERAAKAAPRAPQAAPSVSPGSAQAIAIDMMAAKYGWGGDQANCLINLWQKESGWRVNAMNPSSGATGIPQALPGSKMATHGADWQTNPATQISWGLDYIKNRYGTPCGAWGHSQANGWY